MKYKKYFLVLMSIVIVLGTLIEVLGPNTFVKKLVIEDRVQKYLMNHYGSHMVINQIIYRTHRGGHKVIVTDEKNQINFIVWVIPDTEYEIWDTYIVNLCSRQLEEHLEQELQINGINTEAQVSIDGVNNLPLTWVSKIWNKYKQIDNVEWQCVEELYGDRAFYSIKYRLIDTNNGDKVLLKKYLDKIIVDTLATGLQITKIEIEYVDEKGGIKTFQVEY